jgi:uncharacterized protein YdcH (DUF465 family)
MTGHLDLGHEFPELKQRIHDLKTTDAHFRRLFDEYNELNQAVYRAEQRIDALSDEAEEALRKQRLVLKDQLYTMLKA